MISTSPSYLMSRLNNLSLNSTNPLQFRLNTTIRQSSSKTYQIYLGYNILSDFKWPDLANDVTKLDRNITISHSSMPPDSVVQIHSFTPFI